MPFSARDAGLFTVSVAPGLGSVTLAAPGSGGSSTLLLPMSSADDGQLFDITIYACDAAGNPLTGASALLEVQQLSTFAWNSGTNSTFSRTAGNVLDGTSGAGALVNFTGSTAGYRVAVTSHNSLRALAEFISSCVKLHAGFGGI